MALAVGLAACSSTQAPDEAASPAPSPSTSAQIEADHPPAPQTPGPGKKFYVSLGDSYAAGWQPTDAAANTLKDVSGGTTTNGFAYQLAGRTVAGTGLTLVNYGCSGATTTGMIDEPDCLLPLLGPKAPLYSDESQADAAIDFIAAHRSEVGLITVVIGANDVTRCAHVDDLRKCLQSALATVTRNLDRFLPRLRAAAGPTTPIVGLTYPDVILGGYVSDKDSGRTLAARSAQGFREYINPALAAAYAKIDATFVDVTAASGAYVPLSQTERFAPYGVVPKAVASACRLTYYCQLMDLHPRTVGYTLMADLVQQAVEKR